MRRLVRFLLLVGKELPSQPRSDWDTDKNGSHNPSKPLPEPDALSVPFGLPYRGIFRLSLCRFVWRTYELDYFVEHVTRWLR